MRILDEVITAFEKADVRWSNDPHNPLEYPDFCDALHYLKELKEARNIITTAREEAKKQIEDFKADVEYRMAYNPALTWGELRMMEGMPVWVEALLYKQWAIIAYVGVDHIRFEGVNLYAPESRIYMGEDNGWQAYRKERECGLNLSNQQR